MATAMVRQVLLCLMAAVAALLAAALARPANAQGYPSKPIRLVVSAVPGGAPDIVARLISSALTISEGWNIVVENRPGALQTLAAVEIARGEPDGHSVLVYSMPITTAPSLMPNLKLDFAKDLVPVIKISTSYNVLVVHPSVHAASVSELVGVLKDRPDKMSFSSGGYGTPAHLIGELFKLKTDVKAVHVPYARSNQVPDLLAGVNQFCFLNVLSAVELVEAGKLRALAVTAPARLDLIKSVPTVVEAGFPALSVEDWFALAVKAGTPAEAIGRLNGAANKVLALPDVRAAFAKMGALPAGGDGAQLSEQMQSQTDLWRQVVRDAGIKIPE